MIPSLRREGFIDMNINTQDSTPRRSAAASPQNAADITSAFQDKSPDQLFTYIDSRVSEFDGLKLALSIELTQQCTQKNPHFKRHCLGIIFKIVEEAIKRPQVLAASHHITILKALAKFDHHVILDEYIKRRTIPLAMDKIARDGSPKEKTELVLVMTRWEIHKCSAKPVMTYDYFKDILEDKSPEELAQILKALKVMKCNDKTFPYPDRAGILSQIQDCSRELRFDIAKSLISMRFNRLALRSWCKEEDFKWMIQEGKTDDLCFLLSTCRKTKEWPPYLLPILEAIETETLSEDQKALVQSAKDTLSQQVQLAASSSSSKPALLVPAGRPRWADIYDDSDLEDKTPSTKAPTTSTIASSNRTPYTRLVQEQRKSWADIFDDE